MKAPAFPRPPAVQGCAAESDGGTGCHVRRAVQDGFISTLDNREDMTVREDRLSGSTKD